MYRVVSSAALFVCILNSANALDKTLLRFPEELKAPNVDIPLAVGRIRDADIVGGGANRTRDVGNSSSSTNIDANITVNASVGARKSRWLQKKANIGTKRAEMEAFRRQVDAAWHEKERKQKENIAINAEEDYDKKLEEQLHQQELEKGRRQAEKEQRKVLKEVDELVQEHQFTKELTVAKGKQEGRPAWEMAEKLQKLDEDYQRKIAEKRKFGSEANILAQEMKDAAMAEQAILRARAAAEAAAEDEKALVAEEAQVKEASERAWRWAKKEDKAVQEVKDDADAKAKEVRILQAQQDNATKRQHDLQAKAEAAAMAKESAMQLMRKARRERSEDLVKIVANATEKVKNAELLKVKLEKATRRKDELTQLVAEARTAYVAAEKASAEAEVTRMRMAEQAAEAKRKEEEMRRKEAEAERVAQEKARKSEMEARRVEEEKRKQAVQKAKEEVERDEEYKQMTEQRMVDTSSDTKEQEDFDRRQRAREVERKQAKAKQEKADAEKRAARREDERLRREEQEYQKAKSAAKKASQEAARQVREEVERRAEEERAQLEEEARRVSEKAHRKAKEEAERLVRVEKAKAEKQAKEEAEKAAREQKAREAAEEKAREEARLKALEEAQLRKKAKAEREAKEAAERWAQQMADRRKQEEKRRKSSAVDALQKFLASESGAMLRSDFAPFAQVLNKTSLTQWVNMLNALGKAMKDSSFEKNFTSAGKKLEESVARFATSVKELVASFMANSLGMTGTQLVPLLGNFFNESAVVFAEHLQDAREFRSAVRQAVPQCEQQGCLAGGLDKDLVPMYALMMPFAPARGLLKPTLDGELLPDACRGFTALLADVTDQDANIVKVQKALNDTSKMVPMLNSVLPDLTPRVVTLVLNLAYLEARSLSEASQEVVANLGPVISGRLQCNSTSSASFRARFGLGLLAPLLAMRFTRSIV